MALEIRTGMAHVVVIGARPAGVFAAYRARGVVKKRQDHGVEIC
jgi:flavin-dependent dehydrogenase